MEIISYVGGRFDSRQRKNNFNFSVMTRKLKKRISRRKPLPFKTKKNDGASLKFAFNFDKVFVITKQAISFVKKTWWIILFAMVLSIVPIGIWKIAATLESHTNPLILENSGNTELDILNREMARFAMNLDFDVEEDGSIKGNLSSYNFKEPVKFSNYIVQRGETISGITKKFGLSNISTIIAINNIENVRALNAGKKLRIPSVDGLMYKVKSGDSIQTVAKKYNANIEDILDINDLESETLFVNQELFIPGAKLDKDTLRRAMGDTFINPLKTLSWRLTSRCGWRADPFTGVKQYHPGIDMAIAQGTPIYAALSGKVVACGWSNVYGNYVIIDHANGYQSLYGHMSKKLCTLNQEVSTGTKIGLVGSTGYSTGAHLHFSVYKNGRVVDPLTLIK